MCLDVSEPSEPIETILHAMLPEKRRNVGRKIIKILLYISLLEVEWNE